MFSWRTKPKGPQPGDDYYGYKQDALDCLKGIERRLNREACAAALERAKRDGRRFATIDDMKAAVALIIEAKPNWLLGLEAEE